MAAANIDMVWRDFCAHVLIKLNDCRCVGSHGGQQQAEAAQPGAGLCTIQ